MEQTVTTMAERSDLLAELHLKTRTEHASLNRAIVSRLPLCLQSYTQNAYLYAAGMIAYGQIYLALEESWDKVEEKYRQTDPTAQDYIILSSLRTRYLGRTQRLQSDMRNLKECLSEIEVANLDDLDKQSQCFRHSIANAIATKPHLALAYAWPMYLALFNGGRWIASQLVNAGPEFWWQEKEKTLIEDMYLSFWFFDDSVRDAHHGENVKVDFKQRLYAVSELLDDTQRDEIIDEAKLVFGICTEIISLLDQHALLVSRLRQDLDGKVNSLHGRTWLAGTRSLQSVWNGLRSMVGYTSAPAPLMREFEQHT